MRTGTFSFGVRACSWMAVICCLFPSTRKTRCLVRCGSRRSASSNAAAIMSSMDSVTEADAHLSRAFGRGCALRRAGGAAMSSGSRTAGVKSATATISAIFLIPGCVLPDLLAGVLAVLRAHGDALAVALHHDHVAVRQVSIRVAGALFIEVADPGGQVLGEPGELGAADRDPGAGLDDLLGLPESAAGQVEGGQGPHPQGVRVAGQDLPGISAGQVRL